MNVYKIAIIGTRGIPNQYGGFEQFAMFFSEYLVKQGYEVTVYNSSKHPYKEKEWKGVTIQPIWDPEYLIGTAGQFIYDFLSIYHSRSQQYDIIFQLGYTSSSIWSWLFPKSSILITNMDGLEWKRSKYSKQVQTFLKKAEKWAAKHSDVLIADSRGIQTYIEDKYQKDSTYIAYGASVFKHPEIDVLNAYQLKPKAYGLIIARLEPENNIEMVLDAYQKQDKEHIVVIGNTETTYGKYLTERYTKQVTFLGSIYNQSELDNIRYYSKFYFHGHSVGGTNPSLLEAMATSCRICAHDNAFNKGVLGNDAYYFSSSKDITSILEVEHANFDLYVESNLKKIETIYSFNTIHHQLENLITSCLNK